MKKLFEGWRRFVIEGKMGDKEKQEYLKTLGLYVGKTDGEYNVYIYEWSTERVKAGWPLIVGTLGTMQMDNKGRTPCIPETQEIGSSAVKEERQGRGIGSHMYEVVAYYMKMEQDGGITSDHSASTTNDAAGVWTKLKNKLNYIKRKTPKGPDKETFNAKTGEVLEPYKGENDKFDYGNRTPDPNDDCYEPTDGKSPAPHSLQIPPERMGYVAKLMEIQLDNFDKMMARAKEFDVMDIPSDGGMLFNREYDPYKSGVHGDKAQPGLNKQTSPARTSSFPPGQSPGDNFFGSFREWKQHLAEGTLHYFPDGEQASPEDERDEEEGFWNSFGLIGDAEIDKFVSDIKILGFERAVVKNIKHLGDQQNAYENKEEIERKMNPIQQRNLRIY